MNGAWGWGRNRRVNGVTGQRGRQLVVGKGEEEVQMQVKNPPGEIG